MSRQLDVTCSTIQINYLVVRLVRALNCEDGGSRFGRNVGSLPVKLHGIHAEDHSMNFVRSVYHRMVVRTSLL
jgi:hypothetical protein